MITEEEREDALLIAKDLRYDEEIMELIKKAQTIGDLNRALALGRERI